MGGTGSFGRALAERLAALGREVVIGSRDASRAKEIAAVIGVEGAANEDAAAGADLVILAVRSNAALETARALAPVLGTTPLLSVASDLTFTENGVPEARSPWMIQRISVVPPPIRSATRSKLFSRWVAAISGTNDGTLRLVVADRIDPSSSEVMFDEIGINAGAGPNWPRIPASLSWSSVPTTPPGLATLKPLKTGSG